MSTKKKDLPLRIFEHRESGKADIVAMKALVMTLQGNPVGARQLISKAIHSSPEDADLWKAMAIHLLNYHRYVN